MTLSNEQQNLINDLKAPIKSFRIFALEEAIKSGASQEVLDVLNQLKIEEDDGECQILINYAISAVQGRLAGATQKPAKKIKEQQEFLQHWNQAEESQKMTILAELPARLPSGIKALGPELLEKEKSSIIAAKIIRVFCRGWPEEKFSMISEKLSSESLSLRLASLRTIVHMKPELLLEDLPTLLASEDPQVKALAIRGLAKIDKDEALAHLQALLLSSNLSDRLAGIQNCPFLPFEMVKPLLLKYFAAENHPELLIRAGWILEMNPDVQVPFKLYEIAERSPSRKAEQVKQIINEAVQLLEKSGVLGDKFPLYTRKLQVWVNKRNALRFTKKIVLRLELETIPAELDQLIRNRLKQKCFCEAFAEALNWPVSETVKSRLAAYLKGCQEKQVSESNETEPRVEATEEPVKEETDKITPVAEKAEMPAEAESVSLQGKSEEEIIKILAAVDKAQAQKLLPELGALVANRNAVNDLRIAALHTLARLKVNGCEEQAEKLVTGNDTALATAALEYLGEIDPERVFPYIGQCLKVPDVRMKSAALGILKNFDFNQAVSSLNAMLGSTDPEQQRMALECMDQFDFALIREKLTEYLEKCPNESLVEAGLCHFAANPAAENVYCLYRIEQAQTGSMAAHARKLRNSCNQSLKDAELSPEQQKNQEASCKEDSLRQKWQEDQERKKRSKPAYAYREKTAGKAPGLRENIAAMLELLKDFASTKSSYIFLIVLVLLGIGFYTFFMPGEGPDANAGKGNAIVTGQYLREGEVRRTSGTAVEFESRNGERFVFHPIRDGFRMPRIGDRLRLSLVPYRKDPNGVFLARIRAMRKIESFSQDATGSTK